MTISTAMVGRHFIGVPAGEIHYADAGSGDPVLLLHQTPRSWREYQHVLPLIAPHRRAIAMDTIGFGDSTNRSGDDSIEAYAAAAIQLLDALRIERAAIVGHHTGGVIAIEMAAAYPERVDAVVLSCTPYVDEAHRARQTRHVDDVPPQADGAHATALWQGRQGIYPEGRPDLLTAFLIDALRAGPRAGAARAALKRFRGEEKLPLVTARTLLVVGDRDPCYPDQEALARALGGAPIVTIEDGWCPLPEQRPDRFAAAILDFLGSGASSP